MEFRFRNVNDAFSSMVELIHNCDYQLVHEDTRNGPVMSFEDPVVISYNNPLERVLFNPGRDCNPFFHLVEALWMLAGRNDIAIPAYFNSQMLAYSDDGVTQHAAYGHRWRQHFFECDVEGPEDPTPLEDQRITRLETIDQLNLIVDQLRKDPTTRRLCLAMWDPTADLVRLTSGESCKDLPCNTHCYFRVTEGKYLNLTVCNRSNDMIWGTFGANLVHMSFLQEYIALSAGLQVGIYHQITNNLHTYKDKWKPDRWLKHCTDHYHTRDVTCNDVPLLCQTAPAAQGILERPLSPELCAETKAVFDAEVITLMELMENYILHDRAAGMDVGGFKSPFLNLVFLPMVTAFFVHKETRDYAQAQTEMARCQASDWRKAGREWLLKRERLFNKNAPNYEGE